MNFYDVRGVLVRRWEPVRQGIALEVWDGEGWSPYSDVDAVLRYGLQLTPEKALILLRETRNCLESLPTLSDAEARAALAAPRE